MAIIVNGNEFRTLAQPIYLGGTQVLEAYCNGIKVYPEAPDAIKIIKSPDKTTYRENEEIDYTGIVVQLMTGDYVFRDARYPDGLIPFDELIFPVNTASGADYYEADIDTAPFTQPIPANSVIRWHVWTGDPNRYVDTTITADEGSKLLLQYSYGWVAAYAISKETPSATIVNYSSATGQTWESPMSGHASGSSAVNTFAYDGKVAYIREVAYWWNYAPPYHDPENRITRGTSMQPEIGADFPITAAPAAWAVLYGNLIHGGSSIPVQWESVYEQDKTFEDTFEITIEDAISSGGGDF